MNKDIFSPKMIIIRGPIGSGKSTIVNLLRNKHDNSSMVDYDVFKRMIDHSKSTFWRQKIAFKTALYLSEEIIKRNRTVIIDIHSAKKYQYIELKKLAEKYKFPLKSFLLRPPLKTCLKFVKKRHIPDIKYEIDESKVTKYWKQLYVVKGEPVFDPSKMSAKKITNQILSLLK